MRGLLVAACAVTLLSACATVGEVSAEERARCEAMRAEMGAETRHSHEEVKGTIAQTPMNREHQRCRAILEQR